MQRNSCFSGVLLLKTLGALVVCISSPGQSPVVVFDSFGPGNSYLSSAVYPVQGSATSAGYHGHAEWFIPGISGSFSSATLANVRLSGTGRSNFFLAEDTGAGLPGSILESFLGRGASSLLTLSSSSRPLLQAGVRYWLCAEPYASTSFSGWFENNQNKSPGFAIELAPWSWSPVEPPNFRPPPSGVFRISVIPVPEPSVMSLIVMSSWIFIGRFRPGTRVKE